MILNWLFTYFPAVKCSLELTKTQNWFVSPYEAYVIGRFFIGFQMVLTNSKYQMLGGNLNMDYTNKEKLMA